MFAANFQRITQLPVSRKFDIIKPIISYISCYIAVGSNNTMQQLKQRVKLTLGKRCNHSCQLIVAYTLKHIVTLNYIWKIKVSEITNSFFSFVLSEIYSRLPICICVLLILLAKCLLRNPLRKTRDQRLIHPFIHTYSFMNLCEWL